MALTFQTTGQQRLADLLAKQAMDSSPIQSPWQGLDRMSKALLAGWQMQNADAQQREALPAILGILGGGQAEAPSAPASPMATALAQPQRPAVDPNADAVTEAKTPQDYINRGWGGLTPQGRDTATRTVLGEAANQGPLGMAGVADVMRNRAASGGYGGNTMDSVALAKGQFEPWMTQGGRDRMQAFSQNSPQYRGAQEAVDTAAIGTRPDVTGGASHFYAPKAQAALAPVDGRPVVPPFAAGQQPSAVIGDHNFYAPRTQMAQAGQPQQSSVGARQGMNPAQIEQLRAMASHPNPNVRQFAAGLIQNAVADRFKPADYDFQKRDDGSIVAINKKNPRDMQLIQPPGGSQSLIDFEANKAGAKKGAELRAERAVTEPERRKQEVSAGTIVTQDIDRAIKEMDTSTLPTTGMSGAALSYVPGTASHNVGRLIETMKANAGFQQLNQMRQSSPTGGALGNVTERELAYLQAAIGNLAQSQDDGQLRDNLKRVKNAYLDIIHGPTQGPARESLSFQQKQGSGGVDDLVNKYRSR